MVVDDPGRAGILSGQGRDVVVMVAPGAATYRPAGPGRAAVLVGDPSLAETRRAAEEMDAELFGSRPSASPR